MREKLLAECSHVEQYSTYNAEIHHQICATQRRLGKGLQIGPPAIAAILGALTAIGCLPLYGAWLTALSAVFSSLTNVLDPMAEANAHLRAGKAFTILKHEARTLRDTFSLGMPDEAFTIAVKNLDDRYNDLVRQSPPTTDKAFNKARKKIQDKIHEPD
jgi:hypothetical protein